MGQGVVERNLGGTQDSSEIICDESFEEVVSISLHLGIYEVCLCVDICTGYQC